MKPTPFRPPLRAALAALALACAASSTAGSGQRPAPVAAASAPAPSVAAPPAARPLAPFVGDLASADVAGLKADCAAFLARARGHIEALKRTARPTPRTAVDAALDRYDEALASLDTASSVSNVVFNSNPDAAVRDAARACDQQAQAVVTEIHLDRAVYDVLAGLDLTPNEAADRYWIGQELADFRRAGVDREPATRARIKVLRDEITAIGQKFAQNINDDTRKIELAPSALAGLPADYAAKHPAGADGKVVITTQYPDYYPFMAFARSSAAREQLYRAFRDRAYPKNLEVLQNLLEKRYQLAHLLGYTSFASYSTESKMVRTAQAAHDFIDQITRLSEKRSHDDYQVLLKRLRKDRPGAGFVAAWEAEYIKQRVRAEKLAFDAQSVRPYFEFTRVKAGLLDITARLFGIEYKKVTGAKVWDPDVEVYDVLDQRGKLGRIYLDLHPRAGKFSHAAQFSFVTGKAGVRLPEGVLLCNFPKPGTTPALMDHGEVKTFFHEFGHLLHHVFSGHTRWMSTADFREWDFVEAPSQLLEEWVDDAPTLQRFARKLDTDEPIPTALVERMRTAEQFGRGLEVRQQMVYASVSLAYYDREPKDLDTTKLLSEIESRIIPFPHVAGTHLQASFGHLVDYASNYYTYMWSLVIAKDLFTPFRAAGLLDTAVAARYRRAVLERSGTRPAADQVREFLGRPFNSEAYEKWLNGAARERTSAEGG